MHPHPDDESIACGGALARYVDDPDVDVAVVTCTGGEEGENLAGIDLGGEELAAHRRRELAAALLALGVEEHRYLGYRDSGMAGTPANDHPDSFHGADLDEAAAKLASIIRELRPDVVVSDDANGTYGHPDHVKANRVTVRAVELAAASDRPDVTGEPCEVRKRYVLSYSRGRLERVHRELLTVGLASPFGAEPQPGLLAGVDDGEITTVLDVGPWLERKRAAMAAHRSQVGEDSFFLNLPDRVAEDLFGLEEFVLEQGEPAGPQEDDLFAGLR